MNPTWTRTAGTLLAAVLSGCASLPPAELAPPIGLPGRWSAPARAEEAPAALDVLGGTWWRAFGSAELDSLVARGLSDGFDLAIALQRLEQARGRAMLAEAVRLPTLDAAAGGSRSGPGASGRPSLALQAGVDLDVSGRNGALASSALQLSEAARQDADAVRATLVANIAVTYFGVLSLSERARLAQLIADDAQKTLSLVQTQERLGAASALEVAQQRNALQTFQAAVPILLQQRGIATSELAVLVGAMPERFQLAAQDLKAVEVPAVPADTPAAAISRVPEVRSAEAQLKAANFDVRAARAAFLPNVSITAAIGAAFNPAQALWSLAGSVLQPLFDGGRRQGQLRVDSAHAQELAVVWRKSIAQALLAVEAQIGTVSATRDAEQLDQAAVASARRAYELAQVRFQHGASDFLTVLVSERTLYQAEDIALQVRLQRLQATVGLFRALGAGQTPGEHE